MYMQETFQAPNSPEDSVLGCPHVIYALVITPFQNRLSLKPITDQAIQSDASFFLHCDVPLVARPAFLLPPVSGRAPGSGGPENFPLHFFARGAGDVCRPTVLNSYRDVDRRTEDAQRGHEII